MRLLVRQRLLFSPLVVVRRLRRPPRRAAHRRTRAMRGRSANRSGDAHACVRRTLSVRPPASRTGSNGGSRITRGHWMSVAAPHPPSPSTSVADHDAPPATPGRTAIDGGDERRCERARSVRQLTNVRGERRGQGHAHSSMTQRCSALRSSLAHWSERREPQPVGGHSTDGSAYANPA
jgi:hypothetical protein